MQPRDRAEAARTVLLLSSAAALVTVLLALLRPQQAGGLAVALGVVLPGAALVTLGAYALTRARAEAPTAWTVFPVITVAVIAVLDVATADGSTAAQVFLFFPVLYGAYNLPRAGAVALTGFAAVADVVIATSLLPGRSALVDIVYVVAALITSSGVLIHASERRAALLAMLQRQAAIDPLTGLATRRVLDQTANSVLSGASAHTGTGLILVDVDHFKSVNDRLGHLAGDEVLVAVAALLTEHVRSDSVVSRMGGDEIAILLPGCGREAALRRAEQICASVREHAFVVLEGEASLNLTVSLGVAHAPTQANDLRSLYAAADAALYNAKRAGRDRAAVLPVVDTDPAPRLRALGSLPPASGSALGA